MQTYLCRPKKSRVRLRARTPPFHGGDTGSNPVRGTKALQKCKAFFYVVKRVLKPIVIAGILQSL